MWNCSSCGMEWEASIRDWVNGEAECPHCNKSYYIKIKDKVNMYKRHKESCPFCKGYRRVRRRCF